MRRRIGGVVEAVAVLLVLSFVGFLFFKLLGPGDPAPYVGRTTGSQGHAGDPDAYAFKMTDPATGEPVRFDPCEPLGYVINLESAPDGAEAMVHDAVGTVSDATGIEFVYEGLTDERLPVSPDKTFDRNPSQPDRYGEGWAPLIFLWDRIERSPSSGTVDGTSGAIFATSGESRRYVTGFVVIEHRVTRRPRYLPLVLLHETLHVMGLDHVDDGQIMDHDSTGDPRLGAGDREGLRRLGRDAGCLPPVNPSDMGGGGMMHG